MTDKTIPAPIDRTQASFVRAAIGHSYNVGNNHGEQRANRYDDAAAWFDGLVASHNALLHAAKVVKAGLDTRIQAAMEAGGTAVPVFDGIADLHAAIAKAEGRA